MHIYISGTTTRMSIAINELPRFKHQIHVRKRFVLIKTLPYNQHRTLHTGQRNVQASDNYIFRSMKLDDGETCPQIPA